MCIHKYICACINTWKIDFPSESLYSAKINSWSKYISNWLTCGWLLFTTTPLFFNGMIHVACFVRHKFGSCVQLIIKISAFFPRHLTGLSPLWKYQLTPPKTQILLYPGQEVTRSHNTTNHRTSPNYNVILFTMFFLYCGNAFSTNNLGKNKKNPCGKWGLWEFFHKTRKTRPLMTVSWCLYMINTTPNPTLVSWVVFFSLRFCNITRNTIVVVINFVALYMEYVYILAKGCHCNKVHLLFPLHWNLYIFGISDWWVVDGEVCAVSDPSVITLTHLSTSYIFIPL